MLHSVKRRVDHDIERRKKHNVNCLRAIIYIGAAGVCVTAGLNTGASDRNVI